MGGAQGHTIECRVCGRMFKQVTNSHLRKHGMTTDQYRQQFPGAPLQAESIIMRGDRNPFWGRKHSDESKQKMSETSSANFTDERRAQLSTQMSKQNRKQWSDPKSTYNSVAYRDLLSTSVQEYWDSDRSDNHRALNTELFRMRRLEYDDQIKAIQADPDYRRRLSKAVKASWDSYTPEERQKRLDKTLDAFVNGSACKESKGERTLRRLLEEDYTVDTHKWVHTPGGDRFNVDMHVQELDVWVEFDGVYWHGLDRPIGLIQESGTPTDQTIFMKWQRDRRQDVYFKEKGWTLIRITDLEFKSDPKDCLDRIKKGGY